MEVNKIICGSALEVLKTLPDNSINCCISSPPYWALRNYGVDGQLGLESTFEEYLDKLLAIYDEVFRVLRKDGTCFVNISDTYFGSGKGLYGDGTSHGTEGSKQRTNAGSVGVPNVKSYDTCDKESGDYLNYDFLLSNLCDVCLKSFLIGIIHSSSSLFSKQSLSPSSPIQANKEVLNCHYSSLNFSLQDSHILPATLDFQHLINLSVEQLVSFLLSKASSSFDEFQENASNHNHVEKCPYCDCSLAGDAIPFGHKVGNKKHIPLLASFLTYHKNNNHNVYPYHNYSRLYQNVKPKSLCFIPERFAIGMVDRGWVCRNVLIWHKPNPMPSSASDRFTNDFEYVYFFSKNKQYFFEPQYEELSESTALDKRTIDGNFTDKRPDRNYVGTQNSQGSGMLKSNPLGRNKRCVWKIPTQSCKEAHFATYPEKLVQPMIEAGCPMYVCDKCGKPRKKIYDTVTIQRRRKTERTEPCDDRSGSPNAYGGKEVIGFGYSDCGCNVGFSSGIVLDPFAGSCTTLYVAAKLKRDYLGIELNPKYIEEIANYRVQEAETSITVEEQRQGQGVLFA